MKKPNFSKGDIVILRHKHDNELITFTAGYRENCKWVFSSTTPGYGNAIASYIDASCWNDWLNYVLEAYIPINKPCTTTEAFANAKVGDCVWTIEHGSTTICDISYSATYHIKTTAGALYTSEGKRFEDDKYPSIFHTEQRLPLSIDTEPLPDLAVDTRLIVWDDSSVDDNIFHYHFSHFSPSGKLYCFSSGGTSWTTEHKVPWDNYRVHEPTEEDQSCKNTA